MAVYVYSYTVHYNSMMVARGMVEEEGGGKGRREGGREGGYSQGSTVTIPHYSDCVFVQESHSG